MKVADLIDHRIWQWNKSLLHTTFLQSTVKDILSIKLGEEHDRDKLRWKENKNGCFSVKIAYRVELCLNQPENVEHSTAREDKKFWNKMWKLPIPPKFRNLCGEHAPTYSQHPQTYALGGYWWPLLGEIIELSGGPRHLSTIPLKNFHLFKIAKLVINFCFKKNF